MSKILLRRLQLWTILLLIVTGCSPSDERLVELGQQSADRQAEQNRTIADQSRQVTETTRQFVESSGDARTDMIELQRELVEAEAEARSELIQVQQDLVDRDAQCRRELNALQHKSQSAILAERQSIDRQREDLEADRRNIADKRHRAPIVAAAISQIGLVLACLLPLGLCGYLLYVLRHTGDDDAAVTELLIEEIVADKPLFLPVPGLTPTIAEEPPAPSIEHSQDAESDRHSDSPAPVA
jgi:hypothetical protein